MSLFELSSEESQLQSMTRSFLRGFVDNAYLNAQEESESGFESERWQQIVELGLTGIAIDAESGGAGGTLIDAAIVLREFGRAAFASPLLQTLRAAVILQAAGIGADVRGAIAEGEIATLIAPEGDAVRAERTAAGHTLRGAAVIAEWIRPAASIVLVVPGPDGGHLVAAVPVDSVADRVTDVPSIDNERIALVDVDGLDLGPDAQVAVMTAEDARRALARADLLRASLMVGGAQEVVEFTASYVRERQQFGKPLAAFQAVKQHAGRMVIAADGAQLLCDDALTRIEADPDDTAIARAALFAAGRSYVDIILTAAQLHGGVGTTVDHILHHHFRRAKAMQLRSGNRGQLLRELSRSLVVDRSAAKGSLW
ncbi:acyl-CoA dehydrogenase family protein [Microbacterium sp.]|uniref:acyl-CoA dehydrogenase family protein n=1 Tax=Microbacterium sp. TaxID=51671 RepID=UPI0037CC8D4D